MPTPLKNDPAAVLTIRQRKLIEDFRRQYSIIGFFAGKYRNSYFAAVNLGLSEMDIESECWQGVMRAAQLFDPSRRASFPTYALYWMRSAVSRATEKGQKARARRHGAYLYDGDYRSMDDLSGWEILQVSSRETDPATAAEQNELRERVARVLRHKLPASYRRVFELRFGLGPDRRPRTLAEVGKATGVTRQRAEQILRICLKRLRGPLREVAAVVDGCGIP